MRRTIKQIISLISICAVASFSTGCNIVESVKGLGEKTVNIDDGKEHNVPGYDENNIDAQIQAAQAARATTETEEYVDLTDEELTELADKILTFHSTNNTTSIVEEVKRYEELRSNMNQYAYNVIKRSNCEELITNMQDNLRLSRFKRHDNDSDGISDYYEMMVSNTSPLLNKTDTDKLDSQSKYSLAYIVYISADGETRTIEPEFAPTFYEAIKSGTIKPLDNQYMVINLRAYGRELDSLRLVTGNFNDEVDERWAAVNNMPSMQNVADAVLIDAVTDTNVVTAIYPITFRITGSISTQLAGSVDIEHIDYTDVTGEPAIFLTYSDSLMDTSNIIDFLARTPSSTSLPPDDSIMTDTTYVLLFPGTKTFINDFENLRQGIKMVEEEADGDVQSFINAVNNGFYLGFFNQD